MAESSGEGRVSKLGIDDGMVEIDGVWWSRGPDKGDDVMSGMDANATWRCYVETDEIKEDAEQRGEEVSDQRAVAVAAQDLIIGGEGGLGEVEASIWASPQSMDFFPSDQEVGASVDGGASGAATTESLMGEAVEVTSGNSL